MVPILGSVPALGKAGRPAGPVMPPTPAAPGSALIMRCSIDQPGGAWQDRAEASAYAAGATWTQVSL